MMNALLDRLRKELTPEQCEALELGVRQLRPDLASHLRVFPAATQSAPGEGPPKDDQD